ncbi:hypothetical protein SMB34_18025 [Thalassospira permensis NBRC 106175]|uniref:Uncharacterized protein n=1 Tax=Thalassospira permensis NBRC 106175 TaxID=1353532 RepID=A0ABR4TNF6_9PROT|nr:hypothetical protein SMB34_18025 [Thalassospira permensis NBRC 106175]
MGCDVATHKVANRIQSNGTKSSPPLKGEPSDCGVGQKKRAALSWFHADNGQADKTSQINDTRIATVATRVG